MAEAIGWEDTSVAEGFARGFEIVGTVAASSVPTYHEALKG